MRLGSTLLLLLAFIGSTAVVAAEPAADGLAEARLIDIYRLTGSGKTQEALSKAERLVRDQPNFQLAQLVYGDLLAARARPVKNLGDIPESQTGPVSNTLNELRNESQMRVKALRERPPAGTIPSQFLALSQRNKHAIAVDASRSRLYLFENSAKGLTLVADYYISVGKSGIEKAVEGDLRTPVGVYFITNNLDPKSLSNFYGSGALPINYPNVLDSRRGKTGRGIWLHGTPPNQFSRAPQATDGCVVMANPDLERVIRTVEIRTTPVVISPKIDWVHPQSAQAEGKKFEGVLAAWRSAKSSGNMDDVLRFYTPDFKSYSKTLAEWMPDLRIEIDKARGRAIQLKDVSYLRWSDSTDTMVVTFGEISDGSSIGPTKRQYWVRHGSEWKIFFEGIIA
jgi:murein L,D-transpeptidase YafK